MRLVWKSLDKMRCLRKRSTIPFLGFLFTFLLFLNLYIEDGYVLVCELRVTYLARISPQKRSSQDNKLARVSLLKPDVFIHSTHVVTLIAACF